MTEVRSDMLRWSLLIAHFVCVATLVAQNPEPLRYSGRVVDAQDRPIAGATVVEPGWDNDALGTVLGRTGADGRYAVEVARRPELENTDHPAQLEFHAPGRVHARISVGSLFWIEARPRHGGFDRLDDIVLPSGRPIQVRVHDDKGQPLAGARVKAVSTSQTDTKAFVGWSRAPIYLTRARTDARGRATVRCLAGDSAGIQIAADGYYESYHPSHSPRRPLIVQLTRGGFVRGRVVDHAGRGVRAALSFRAEVDPLASPVSDLGLFGPRLTREDGTFAFNVPHRGRYLLTAERLDVRFTMASQPEIASRLLAGPAANVELRLPKHPKSADRLRLTVFDAKTGQPIAGARGTVSWTASFYELDESLMRHELEQGPGCVKQNGSIQLPPPLKLYGNKGTALIRAPGYASQLVKVDWSNRARAHRVDLHAEVPVRGIVVSASGEPVAEASVSIDRAETDDLDLIAMPWRMRRPGVVHTDDKGRFHIPERGPGKYRLTVRHAGFPDAVDVPVTVAAGGGEPIRVQLPQGFTVRGKVKAGRRLPVGSRLVLIEPENEKRPYPYPRTIGAATRIAGDGGFAITAIPAGEYRCGLSIPRVGFAPHLIELPRVLKVSRNARGVAVDASEHAPVRRTGKLAFPHAKPPLHRLRVEAVRPQTWQNPFDVFASAPTATQVQADGTFAFDVPPGPTMLQVVDTLTGVVLKQQDLRLGPDRQAPPNNIEIALATVHVRLEPEKRGGAISAALLTATTGPKKKKQSFDQIGILRGVPLNDGRREAVLYLPKQEVQLKVVAHTKSLDPERPGAKPKKLGKHEFTPTLGERNEVTIRVEEPPKIGRKKNKKKRKKK